MDSTFDEVTESRSQEESNPALAKRAVIEAQAFAGFWIRFWAFILDWLVVWGVNHLTVSPIFSLFGWSKGGGWFSPFSVTTTIVFLLYFAIMTKIFQQTLGKMVFGIKVVSLQPEKRLAWDVIFFREIVGRYINTLFVLYAVVGFSPKSKGFMITLPIRWSSMNIYMKKQKQTYNQRSLAGYRSNSFFMIGYKIQNESHNRRGSIICYGGSEHSALRLDRSFFVPWDLIDLHESDHFTGLFTCK